MIRWRYHNQKALPKKFQGLALTDALSLSASAIAQALIKGSLDESLGLGDSSNALANVRLSLVSSLGFLDEG